MPGPGPPQKRLIFVTGKGGVGKSTVAAALGIASARRGLRTVVVELGGQHRLAGTFGRHAEPFTEVELEPGLFTISVEPQDAMLEWFRVSAGAVGQTVGQSRVFSAFAMATPGMRELLTMGKIWELAQPRRRTSGALPYDLVVVDAPASGHGAGILRTPATFASIARVGPIAHQARTIAATIADRTFTGVLAVSLPEEMPVNETLGLEAELRTSGMHLDAVVLNAMLPRRFTGPELDRAEASAEPTPLLLAALTAARDEHARAARQRRQRERLRAEITAPLSELPLLEADGLGEPELSVLAALLGRRLASSGGLVAGASKEETVT